MNTQPPPRPPCLSLEETHTTDDGFKIWQQALIFGEAGQGVRTYLVVDATQRATIKGAFDLDQVDVPCKSLFDGPSAVEFAQAAPYLLDLTLPTDDDAPMPRATRDFLTTQWGHKTGVLIRSKAGFDEIRHHLRFFLRLRRADTGAWVLFRYWDGRVALPYFEHLAQDHIRAASWFFPDPEPLIEALILEGDEPETAWRITPQIHLLQQAVGQKRPARTGELTEAEIAVLGSISARIFYREAAREMVQHVTLESRYKRVRPADRTAYLSQVGRFAEGQGFTSRQAIVKLGLLSLVLGLNFAEDGRFDPELRAAMNRNPASETERLIAARALFDKVAPLIEADGGTAGINARVSEVLCTEAGKSPAPVMRRVAPAQLQSLSDAQLDTLALAFFQRYPALRDLSQDRQRAAVAMLAGYGADWPSNPLYGKLWLALFEPDWKDIILKELEPLDSENTDQMPDQLT